MDRGLDRTPSKIRSIGLAGVSVLALASQTSRAQGVAPTVSSADGSTVQEIVVTAQKREETASKVPESITAATGEQLKLVGISQPRDLVRITPSFNYTDSYVGSPIYTLRGVGFSDISLGGRSTVAVYTDEAPLPFPIETRGADLDLERVEVLKGPQGTLFGQNATGGAINYIAAKPTRTFQAGFDAGYGNYNAVDVDGYVGGPLTDTVSARLSAEHTGNDGWQKSYTTGARNGSGDFTNARLLLNWTPTGKFKAQFNVNGWSDHSELQAGQLIAITPQIPAAAAFVPGLLSYPLAPHNDTAADFNPDQDYHRHNGFFQANARLDYALTDTLTLTSITSFSRYTEHQLQDIDGTTLSNLNQLTLGRITSISEELRLSGDFSRAGHFVAGFNYAHDKVLETDFDNISQSTVSFTFTPFGLPLFTTYRDSDNQVSDTTAGFVSVDYDLGKGVKLYGGARYTEADDRFNGCTADTGDGVAAGDFGFLYNFYRGMAGFAPNPPIAAGGCVTAGPNFVPGLVTNTLDQHNVSWRGGAQWTLTDGTLLYANASKGFKAGGFPDLAATTASQFIPASQESVIAYEAGFKTALFSRTVHLDGAVFYYDYHDKQILGRVLDPVFGPVLRLVNVPKSDLAGAELQLVWAPARGLTFTSGGSYISSRIRDDFTNYDPNGVLTNFNGEPFPNTPKWQVVADGDYRFGLTQTLDGFVGGNINYESSTNSQLGELPLLDVKAYTLVDLRIGVASRDGFWRLTGWVRNAGNTYYWTSANRDLDTSNRFAGMPRTYGVTLAVRYR